MKLASGFQMVEVDGKQYVTSAVHGFNGQIVCNDTASFIMKKLKHRTSERAICKAVCRAFDAPADQVEADVRELLQALRGIGALEE